MTTLGALVQIWIVSHKCCVTSLLLCAVGSCCCLFTVLPMEACCESHLFPSPARRGALRVFSAWKCVLGSAESEVLSAHRSYWAARGWGREAAELAILKGHNNPWQLSSCFLSLKVSWTESEPSVLSAVLFPREIPKEVQLLGSDAVESPCLGHLGSTGQGGWVMPGLAASRVLLGYFLHTTSLMCLRGLRWQRWKETGFIVLVGHVAAGTGLWQSCLDGFVSSVGVDALSVFVKVKQVPLASTNFLLSV